MQATLGVDAGGLGLRDASLVARPAFIASRVASRLLVTEMASHLNDAGLCSVAQCMEAFDDRTQQEVQRRSQALPEPEARRPASELAGPNADRALLPGSRSPGDADSPGGPLVGRATLHPNLRTTNWWGHSPAIDLLEPLEVK